MYYNFSSDIKKNDFVNRMFEVSSVSKEDINRIWNFLSTSQNKSKEGNEQFFAIISLFKSEA